MKTIRLSESQLVDLINKVVTENQLVGIQGMSPMPEATATEEPKKETVKVCIDVQGKDGKPVMDPKTSKPKQDCKEMKKHKKY